MAGHAQNSDMVAFSSFIPALALISSNLVPGMFPDKRCQVPSKCAINIHGVENRCYKSLGDAVKRCPEYGTIRINKNIKVTNEIKIIKTLHFIGCSSTPPRVIADISLKKCRTRDCGIFRVTKNWKKISLVNLAFERKIRGRGKSFATLLRTPELGNDEFPKKLKTGPVGLMIYKCSFRNFLTRARGGSVIFIGRASRVVILDSLFKNNMVLNGGERWEGGGAVWIRELPKRIGAIKMHKTAFIQNRHYFPHSEGGAFYCGNCSGKVFIKDCVFKRNLASAGGAIFMEYTRSLIKILHSEFESNEARDLGLGSRGGAMWIKHIKGPVIISGHFKNNTAITNRGGVLASNTISGSLTLSGVFTKNRAKYKRGSIVDVLGRRGFAKGGRIKFKGNSIFKGNYPNHLIKTNVTRTKLLQSDWRRKTVLFEA